MYQALDTRSFNSRLTRTSLMVCCALFWSTAAHGHGGVVLEEDQCVINIGFYKAHFTVYQPQTRGNTEFCEDLPDTGPTIFVLDYLHNSMKDVPVEIRIIRDATGLERFAGLSDVLALGDLTPHTVFYHPPSVEADGALSVEHRFEETGYYIGIVRAQHPTKDRVYTAVFPFEVGYTGVGYWPWIALAIVLIQLPIVLRRSVLFRLRAAFARG